MERLEGVKIASTPEEFVAACDEALELSREPESGWLAEADLPMSPHRAGTRPRREWRGSSPTSRNSHRNDLASLVAAE